MPKRIGIGDGGNSGQPFGRTVGKLLSVRTRREQNREWSHSLQGRLTAIRIFALGEQRDSLVPVFVFADGDRLQDIAADQILHVR